MVLSPWFNEPSDLIELPAELYQITTCGGGVSSTNSSSYPAPLHAPVSIKNTESHKKARVANEEVLALPTDRAKTLAHPLGRCRALVSDKRCAVPYALGHFDSTQIDNDGELLMVELRAPDGTDGWLDDRSLTGVFHPDTQTIYSLSALRRLVQAKVTLGGGARTHSRNLKRALYNVCEPERQNKLTITVVVLADLQSFPLVSGEDPPEIIRVD